MSNDASLLIVGAGPAGLAIAIRFRQLCLANGVNYSVLVLEKAPSCGSHTLSGALMDPSALLKLIPTWAQRRAPPLVVATESLHWLVSRTWSLRMPTPAALDNVGSSWVVSLGQLVAEMGQEAESLGAEVLCGVSAASLILEDAASGQRVAGVRTQDLGLRRDGRPGPQHEPGAELRADLTVLAEGARGSLTKAAIATFGLDRGRDPQTFGLGLKEVWEVAEGTAPGRVVHTMGWPADNATWGGGFMYYGRDNLLSLGYVVGLDYANPYLSPYGEFQRWKTHPLVSRAIDGARCLAYGARVIAEGGGQAVPRVDFPGGGIVGCAAGLLDVPRIKGIHQAIDSGALAAEAAFEGLMRAAATTPPTLATYATRLSTSRVMRDLHRHRNIRPAFSKWGNRLGALYAGIDAYVLRGREPWTLRNAVPDHKKLTPANRATAIVYPPPNNRTTFPLLTSLARSGVGHREDQPPHLRLRDPGLAIRVNLAQYAGPEQRYCPAGVYEYRGGGLTINAANCLHCKACDVKDPSGNIDWTTPEGGGGPNYAGM